MHPKQLLNTNYSFYTDDNNHILKLPTTYNSLYVLNNKKIFYEDGQDNIERVGTLFNAS